MVHIILFGEIQDTDRKIFWRNIPTIIGYIQFFTSWIPEIKISKLHLEEEKYNKI